MCKKIKECIELFELKIFVEKLSIYRQLKNNVSELNKQIDENKFPKNLHRIWEAGLLVTLSNDRYIKQEVRDTVKEWKNTIDKKLAEDKSSVVWSEELLILKNMIIQVKAGVNPWFQFLITFLIIVLLSLFLWFLANYFSININFGK